MIVLFVPSLFSPPVLAELQLADLITSEECEKLRDISGVVRVQAGKSPEVMSKTAEVLRRRGLVKESNLFAGRLSRPSCYVDHINVVCPSSPFCSPPPLGVLAIHTCV